MRDVIITHSRTDPSVYRSILLALQNQRSNGLRRLLQRLYNAVHQRIGDNERVEIGSDTRHEMMGTIVASTEEDQPS